MPPESVESFGDNVPLGRAGQPAELAPIYVLLASDDASYISGARVAVDRRPAGSPAARTAFRSPGFRPTRRRSGFPRRVVALVGDGHRRGDLAQVVVGLGRDPAQRADGLVVAAIAFRGVE
jgi:Enoyl-(Acyl carrier protein) reductase